MNRNPARSNLGSTAALLLAGAVMFPRPVFAGGSAGVREDGVFARDQRLLTTYFFSRGPWDDTRKTGRNGGPWPEVFPGPGDPLASAYGLDSGTRWPGNQLPDTSRWPADYHQREAYPLWLMAEWRAMKWSGFDFVLVDVWPCLWFHHDASPRFAFTALVRAWKELDRRGEHPLPLALFLETPFGWLHPHLDGDVTQSSPDGIAELWEPTEAFLRPFYGDARHKPSLPLRALARIEVNGEARPVLQYWFPYWPPRNGHGIRKWNEWTFRELRRKCRAAFGVEPYIGVNQHVHGPGFIGGWNSVQPDGGRVDIGSTSVVDYDVAWWGGLLGPQVYPHAIALGPGHWMRRQTGDKVPSRHWDPRAYAPDAYRYLHCWRQVLTNPDNFRRKLLLVESWNNTLESCAVCCCLPREYRDAAGAVLDRWGDRPGQYMVWTRRLAPFWKTGRKPESFPPP